MKKISFILLLFTSMLMESSCKKDKAVTPTDARDVFIGNWQGSIRVIIPDLTFDQSSAITYTFSKSSSNPVQILNENGIANVNGNSYVYNQFTETTEDPTLGTLVFLFNGTGTLNGSNLTESGTLNTVIQGTTYNGTWSTNLVKQ